MVLTQPGQGGYGEVPTKDGNTSQGPIMTNQLQLTGVVPAKAEISDTTRTVGIILSVLLIVRKMESKSIGGRCSIYGNCRLLPL